MSNFPPRHDSFDVAPPSDAPGNGLQEQELQTVPISLRIAVFGWFIITALLLRAVWKSLAIGNGSAFVFFLLAAGIVGILITGLLRRSMVSWWWNQFLVKMLGMFCVMPLIFGAACVVFQLAGGAIPDELSYLVKVIIVAGIYLLLPAALFLGIYVSLNTQKARQYCHVCLECSRRFKAPIQFLFHKMECDNCKREA